MSSPSTLASMIRAAQRTLPASPLATSSRRTLTSSAPRRADDPTSGVRDYVQSLTSSASSASSSSRTPAFRAGSRSPASPSFAVNSPRAAPNHLGAMRSPSAGPGGVGAGGVARPAANATAKAQAIRMAFHGQVSTRCTCTAQRQCPLTAQHPTLAPAALHSPLTHLPCANLSTNITRSPLARPTEAHCSPNRPDPSPRAQPGQA